MGGGERDGGSGGGEEALGEVGKTENGKTSSTKITWREMITFLVARSRHLYPR